jgi:hypothetical protein
VISGSIGSVNVNLVFASLFLQTCEEAMALAALICVTGQRCMQVNRHLSELQDFWSAAARQHHL